MVKPNKFFEETRVINKHELLERGFDPYIIVEEMANKIKSKLVEAGFDKRIFRLMCTSYPNIPNDNIKIVIHAYKIAESMDADGNLVGIIKEELPI